MAESMTVRGAADALQRSERSIRRYLQEGRLEYDKEPTRAGFRYAITAASVERLRGELQGRRAQGSNAGIAALTAEVQALRQIIEELRAEVASLPKALPPAPEERAQEIDDLRTALAAEKARSWWQKLVGRGGGRDGE